MGFLFYTFSDSILSRRQDYDIFLGSYKPRPLLFIKRSDTQRGAKHVCFPLKRRQWLVQGKDLVRFKSPPFMTFHGQIILVLSCNHKATACTFSVLWESADGSASQFLNVCTFGTCMNMYVIYLLTHLGHAWICMLSIFLPSTESVAEWLRCLTSDLGIVSSSPTCDSFFFCL